MLLQGNKQNNKKISIQQLDFMINLILSIFTLDKYSEKSRKRDKSRENLQSYVQHLFSWMK